jgi:tRNA pseudouridine55 synthase
MGRRRAGLDIHGILLLDKPAGISSNQAVQRVRRLLNARKAGHSGSLDPFATGMLPVCLGEASKTAAFMLEASKTYRAVARLGQRTSTGDIEGALAETQPVPALEPQDVEKILAGYRGTISQVPPMYSALKHQGQPLYKLARQGLCVERQARQVTIHRLEFIEWSSPLLTFKVHCSKGTYVRTLAEDICASLGSCGHLKSLRRLDVEPFDPELMITLEELEHAVGQGQGLDVLLPVDAGLPGWPKAVLDHAAAERFGRGIPVTVHGVAGMTRVYGDDGKILGLGEVREAGLLHPKRVFDVGTRDSSSAAKELV